MKNRKILVFAVILIALTVVYFGIRFHARTTLQREIDREIANLSKYGDIRYGGLHVDILRSHITLRDVRITPHLLKDSILIDVLAFSRPTGRGSVPEEIRFTMQGIHFENHGILRQLMEKIGYPGFRGYLECASTYDSEHFVLHIRELKIGADDVAEARLHLRLENLNLRQIPSSPENVVLLLSAVSAVSIAEGDIHYADDSLLPRLYAAEARKSGQPVEAYIAEIIRPLEDMLRRETDPKVKAVLGAFKDFLAAPGRLRISIRPKRPVSLFSLYWVREPKRLVDLLGIHAET